MNKSFNWWARKLHRWGALFVILPLLLVITSGLLLQLKKNVAWVQPPTMTGSGDAPTVDWNLVLDAAKSNPNSGVKSWADIGRLDVQPAKGIIKICCNNQWEIQIDAQTAMELSSARRRSDFIERLHDGSFFGNTCKLGIFLPNGIVLLCLWITGVYLWYLPYKARRKKRMRLAKQVKQ